MNGWSRAALWVVVLACLGCAEGAKLVRETESGGVVTYPFKGDNGPLVSSFRTEAIQLIEKRCGGAYVITREGEAKGRSRVANNAGYPEVITERRWGLEFRCRK